MKVQHQEQDGVLRSNQLWEDKAVKKHQTRNITVLDDQRQVKCDVFERLFSREST